MDKQTKHINSAIKWIKDAFKMMDTKGCGWTDASDSLTIALRELESAKENKNG